MISIFQGFFVIRSSFSLKTPPRGFYEIKKNFNQNYDFSFSLRGDHKHVIISKRNGKDSNLILGVSEMNTKTSFVSVTR